MLARVRCVGGQRAHSADPCLPRDAAAPRPLLPLGLRTQAYWAKSGCVTESVACRV